KMSDILGLGANSYRQYESGEMPSTSIATLIRMADNPKSFLTTVESITTLDVDTKSKIIHRIHKLIEAESDSANENVVKAYLVGSKYPDIFSGYRTPNLDRFAEMVVFFAERLQPFKTKLNKLLFYAD